MDEIFKRARENEKKQSLFNRAREAEKAQLQKEQAQQEQRNTEAIQKIASANPYSPENLGPSPQAAIMGGTRNRGAQNYGAILDTLGRSAPKGLDPSARHRLAQDDTRLGGSIQDDTQTNGGTRGMRASREAMLRQKARSIGLPDPTQGAADGGIVGSASGSLDGEGVRWGRGGGEMESSRSRREQKAEQAETEHMQRLLRADIAQEESRLNQLDDLRRNEEALQAILSSGGLDSRYDLAQEYLPQLQAKIQELEEASLSDQEIRQAQKLQRLREIEQVADNQDFWGKSLYDPQFASRSQYRAAAGQYETEGDLIYDYVNDRNDARSVDAANAAASGADVAGVDLRRLAEMSAQEKRIYNYLYETQGKEQADEYLELLSGTLNARQMESAREYWTKQAREHPAAASALSVALSPTRGLSYLGQAVDYAKTGEIDQNAGVNQWTNIPNSIRSEVSRQAEAKWGKTGSFLYQTGMSMADFLTQAALSGSFLGNAPGSAAATISEALSLTIMGTGAAADATIAAKERGLSDDQAFALGTIAGAAEILTEKVSMESLLDMTGMDRSTIGYLLKNTLAEGSEEVGSDFVNLFADILISKDKSEWAQSVKHYEDLGYQGNRPFWMAVADQAQTMGVDLLGGALSGLAMAGGSVAVNRTARSIQQRKDAQLRAITQEVLGQELRTGEAVPETEAEPIREEAPATEPEAAVPAQEETHAQETAPEAEPENLAWAKELAADGADPAFILAATGYEQDVDGSWHQMGREAMEQAQAQQEADTSSGAARHLPLEGKALETETAAEAGEPTKEELSNDSQKIVEKLRESIPQMQGTEPVTQLTGNEFPKGKKKLTEQVAEFFEKLGNMIHRSGFGDVVLDKRGVKSDIAHGIGRAKAITFAAVPDVIARGRQIDYVQNWKGRGRDSYVFAAPVQIGAQTNYVAAVVMKENDNRFYLHEVVDENGNVIYAKKEAASATSRPGVTGQAGVTGITDAVSLESTPAVSRSEYVGETDTADLAGELSDPTIPQQGREVNGQDLTGGTDNEVLLHEGSQRESGAGTGGQAGAVAESSERAGQRRTEGQGTVLAGRFAAAAGELRSSKELGIKDGLDSKTIRLIPADTDPELQEIQARAQGMGLEVQFLDHALQVKNRTTRRIANVSAVFDSGTGRILVCATGTRYSTSAQYGHEEFHALAAANRNLVSDTWRALEQRFGEERMRTLALQAFQDYAGIYGTEDEDLHYYQEEVLADLYGDLNRKGRGLDPEMQRIVQEMADRPSLQTPGEAREAGELQQDGARYLIKYPQFTQEELRENALTLQEMEPVAHLTGKEFPKGEVRLKDQVLAYFESLGNNIRTEQFGDVALTNSSWHSEQGHGLTEEKGISFAALPDVLNNGVVIDVLDKGERLERVTVAAPIQIADKLFAMGVMLNRDYQSQRLYIHDVVIKNVEDRHGPNGKRITVTNVAPTEDDNDGLYLTNILENALNVKRESASEAAPLSGEDGQRFSLEDETPERKAKQFEIIQEHNPAPNSYLTWIRSADEIRTLDEAINDPEWDYDEYDPDWTKRQALDAIEAGEIHVYSSTPIKPGSFVTPSRMEAQSYSGTGNLFEQTVRPEDIAWIDPTQGQFAPLSSEQQRFSIEDEETENVTEEAAEQDGVEDARAQIRQQAEAMSQAQLEQRLKTDRAQAEKYQLLRSEGRMTEALERKARIHEEAMQTREQVLREKRGAISQDPEAAADLALQVGSKENIRQTLRELERRRSALELLPSDEQAKAEIKKISEATERIKKELRSRNRAERQQKREELQRTAQEQRAFESRTKLRDELLRSYSVAQDQRGRVGGIIDDFASRIEQEGRITREDRNRLFRELIDSGAVRVITDDYAAQIRDELRGTRIYVPEDLRAEWKGDFDAFRRRAWGAGIYLTNNPADGGWDTHNAELADAFGGRFSAEETDGKLALEAMLAAAEEGKPQDMSLKEWLELENGGSEEGARSAMQTMLRELDNALSRFAGAAQMEIDTKARSVMEEAREQLELDQRAERARQRRSMQELQQQTMASMKELRRLRGKTDNETRARIDAAIGNIDLLARSISPEGLENLQALAEEYNRQKEEQGQNFIPNPYVEERLARLTQKHVADMDESELRELGNTVSAMVTSIRNARQLIGDEHAQMIEDAATEWNEEIQGSRGMQKNLLNRWLKADQVRPSTFLGMISGWRDGGAGARITQELEDGELKQLRFLQRASEHFDPFVSDKAVQKWLRTASGTKAKFIDVTGIEGLDAEGNAKVSQISITPMMRVALYMHAQNADNLRHIKEGGVRIPDKELYLKGKVDEAYNRGRLVLLEPEQIYKILGGSPQTHDLGANLSAEEKRFARLLQSYMDGMSKEAINETSMALDGFERAMERNYYPIQTDKKFIASQPETVKRDISVENTGSIANERIHAANPIELRDASDTLAWHMEQTARYHGMAVPIHNLSAVYGYNFLRSGEGARYAGSIKNTLGQKWGGDASHYLEQMMADLQGGQSAELSTIGQISAQLRGKLAGATLTLNPSVALSQLASYPAALQQLGVRAAVSGLNLANRVDESLIAKYSPLLWYRAQGNITDEINREGLKLPRALDWISEMDRAAIKRLWAASEAWVEQNADLRRPSSGDAEAADQFYQRVAEKFNRCVWDTQPNYTTMQRTQLQRQGNELTKILAMYKTVPLQYYNMMLEAHTKLQETGARAKAETATQADKDAYSEAQNFAARTHAGLLISNLVYVAMKTVLMNGIFRKKGLRDEDGEITVASVADAVGWSLAEVYAGSIVGSDVLMQTIKHFAKGDRVYGLELSSIETINDLMEQGRNLGDYLGKIFKGTAELDEGLDAIHDAGAMAARMFGLPAENAEKYLLAATKWIAPEWAYRYENLFDELDKADTKGLSERDTRGAIAALMDNRTDDLQDETIEELTRLWREGMGNVLPTAIPSKLTVDGEEITMSRKQKQDYRKAWSDAVSESLQDLMDTEAYQQADDAQRQKMIQKLYDYAAGKAREAAAEKEPDAWIQAFDGSGMDLADYVARKAWLDDMEKTEDETAAEIRGEELLASDLSREEQAQTYYAVLAAPETRDWIDERVATGDSLEDVAYTMLRFASAENTREKLELIRESGLNEENKLELFHKISKEQDEKIEAFRKAGMDLDDYLEIRAKYTELNSAGGKAGDKSAAFSNWLDKGKWTQKQKDTAKEQMGFFSMVRAEAGKYDALTAAGLSSDKAMSTYETISALEPEEGKSQVSDLQKLEAIGKSRLSEKEKAAAAKVYLQDAGDAKLDVLVDHGVSVSEWAAFQRAFAEAQAAHKGEKNGTQLAAQEAALEAIGVSTATPQGREKAAALWQTANKSWKSKNNPFDAEIGEKIYSAMN